MNIFTLLLILLTVFIVNIWLYWASEDYRSFLKSFKNDEVSTIVNDDYIIENDETDISLEADLDKKINLGNSEVEYEEWDIATIQQKITEDKRLVLSEYEKEVLFLFKEFSFTKLLSHSSLLGITDEFPDEYFEYYSPDVTLLMFSNSEYADVKEKLTLIWDLENFSINEIDNFGEESFYINMDEWSDDGNVRVILTNKWKVFWLKISKNEYNNVKRILEDI